MLTSAAALACAAAAAVAAVAVAEPWEYALFDMGNLGLPHARANAINEIGQVTGLVDTWESYRAFLWEAPGPMLDLGKLAGDAVWSEGLDINNFGWVVGENKYPDGNDRPTLWRDGEIIDLTGDIPGFGGTAWGVNDNGLIAGKWKEDLGGGNWAWTAFAWEDGVMKRLPKPPGQRVSTSALSISNTGSIVGIANADDLPQYPMLWHDGGYTALPPLNPGSSSIAWDVNDFDEVTGSGRERGGFNDHAWLWSDGTLIDLHGLGKESSAYGMNNIGTVVGYATMSDTLLDNEAFRWTEAEGMVNLNDRIPPHSGYTLNVADDVNDVGQIVGHAMRAGGGYGDQAFLLTPVHVSMTLESASGRLTSGQHNEIIITGATPGRRVYLAYAYQGGGSYIPGCTLEENALQLQYARSLGSVTADATGRATFRRWIPDHHQDLTVLLQAVIPAECAVSELIVETIE